MEIVYLVLSQLIRVLAQRNDPETSLQYCRQESKFKPCWHPVRPHVASRMWLDGRQFLQGTARFPHTTKLAAVVKVKYF